MRLQSTQWTQRLAELADSRYTNSQTSVSNPSRLESGYKANTDGVDLALRLEGPYFSPADTFRYDTVICLVAGTGISGAIAIASAFNTFDVDQPKPGKPQIKPKADRMWRRCIIMWSVRENNDVELPFIEPKAEGLELRKFLTGPGRERVDLASELTGAVKRDDRTWVYISGPAAYINAGKAACQTTESLANLEYYAASWDI